MVCVWSDNLTEKREKFDVICFGGEDWWYHNRGHIDFQLMRRFAQMGTVLYINSIVMQKPNLREATKFVQKLIRKTRSIFTGLKKSGAGFWVYSPFCLPIHHISWITPLNEILLSYQISYIDRKLGMSTPIIWVACPTGCDTAIKLKKTKLVYQRTDRYEAFPNVDVKTITAYDQKLKAEADLTVFVSAALYSEEAGQCKKAIYLDHGVDLEMFASAEHDTSKPTDIAGIQKPMVGYFGAIDGHKFDICFIETVVDLLPHMSFVFIGNTLSDCSGLLAKNNVRMLGQKPYEQIPHYGKCFDVAIMPLQKNRWTEQSNPIKLKEYLALGKPIVSTPFPELQKYRDVVYQAEMPEKFARCIEKALEDNNAEQIAARKKTVEEASWDSKAQLVLKELFDKDGSPQG
ncbi:glycosyltransferase [Planctomycetota bacterium]